MSSQPPREEKQNTERRSGQQDVSLEKLPVAGNGMIVVTPDLKRALDSLGAGSVVLSAERYKELMSRIESSKTAVQAQEILFSKCSITGEVSNKSGREMADLTFDLEFRTETKDTVIALPLKGLRLSAASLNGAPPLWGPDPENWTILVKEPQVCRLKVSTSVPINRVGQEKRLLLERVPASAITSLSLKVAGAISQPVVAGYGNIQAVTGPEGNTLLQAPALGVLSRMELTWQPGAPSNATQASMIEGDIRIQVEATHAMVEARLKPVPFAPFQLPWKVRLPANAQNVRAELLRSEGMSSEPLVVMAQKDGVHQITSAYPLVTSGFVQLLVRWKQALPENEASDSMFLGGCEVIEPAGRQQAGTVQFNMPDEAVALFRPRQLISLERISAERENRRQQQYRYEQQPAGFDVLAVSRRQARGMVEAKIRHVVTAQPQSWLMNTEIELSSNARTQLQHVELSWPADWKLNRRILFSPVIKDMEHDDKNNRVRLILDAKQTSPLVLKLEGQSNTIADHVTFPLPQLLKAECLSQDRLVPAELLLQKEQLKLEGVNAEVRLSQVDKAFQEETLEGVFSQNQFRVLSHPATLTLTRTLRLPQYVSHADVFVGEKECITQQTFQFAGNTVLPRQMQALIPRIARSFQWTQQFSDGRKSEPVAVKSMSADDDGAMQQVLLELPAHLDKEVKLVCTLESLSAHPITVPLARLHPSQASLQKTVTVKAVCDTGIAVSLPPDLPGWSAQSERMTSSITGDSLTPLLVLEKKSVPTAERPVRVQRMSTTVINRTGTWLMETVFEIGPVNQTPLTMTIPLSASQLRLHGWKLNGETMPANQMKFDSVDDLSSVKIQLPVSALKNQVQVALIYEVERSPSLFWWRFPVFSCKGNYQEDMVPHDWFLQGDANCWLWASNATIANWNQATEGWKPVSTQALATQGQLNGFQLTNFASDPSLWVITFPRIISLVALSLATLVVFQFAVRQAKWKHRLILLLLLLWCCLYVTLPSLALAILWSCMPGLLACLCLAGWSSWVAFTKRGPRVFQSTEQLTVIKSRAQAAVRMPKSGYDAPTVLASKPPAIP